MRAVVIAFLLLCIQIGFGVVVQSDIFGDGIVYENQIVAEFSTNPDNPLETESEQNKFNMDSLNKFWNIMSWGFITIWFEPIYTNDLAARAFIDAIVAFLQVLTTFVVSVALIEVFRDNLRILR